MGAEAIGENLQATSVRGRRLWRLAALLSVVSLLVTGISPSNAVDAPPSSLSEETPAVYADARSVSGARSFRDVPSSYPFLKEITWLAANEVTTGWPDGTFRPVTPVNRDAMAAFMYRLMGKQAFAVPTTPPFADVPLGNQFYKDIAWLSSSKISTGWKERSGVTTYRPFVAVNRDAMAAFMYRMAGSPDFTPPSTSPFADLRPTTQFYKEITWLNSTGISKGWDEGGGRKTYRPLQPVNRDAMAAFMFRFTARDQRVSPGRDITANLGPRAAGHASALVRLTVRNAGSSATVSIGGAPALSVAAGHSASATVLTPLANAAATISATSETNVRADLIATFDGRPESPVPPLPLPSR